MGQKKFFKRETPVQSTEVKLDTKPFEIDIQPEEVVIQDVYWGKDGIARRVVSSDDEATITRLMNHGWLKELKEEV